jgi:hypothetical protein
MEDQVGAVNQLGNQRRIEDGANGIREMRVIFQVLDVCKRAGRKVVDYADVPAFMQTTISEVRTDKSRTASDKYVHRIDSLLTP